MASPSPTNIPSTTPFSSGKQEVVDVSVSVASLANKQVAIGAGDGPVPSSAVASRSISPPHDISSSLPSAARPQMNALASVLIVLSSEQHFRSPSNSSSSSKGGVSDARRSAFAPAASAGISHPAETATPTAPQVKKTGHWESTTEYLAEAGVSLSALLLINEILERSKIFYKIATSTGQPAAIRDIVSLAELGTNVPEQLRRQLQQPLPLRSVHLADFSGILLPHSLGAAVDLLHSSALGALLSAALNGVGSSSGPFGNNAQEGKAVVCSIGYGGYALCANRLHVAAKGVATAAATAAHEESRSNACTRYWISKTHTACPLEGYTVTGVSAFDECRYPFFGLLPCMLQELLEDNGASFVSFSSSFDSPACIVDRNLISGPNEASTQLCVQTFAVLVLSSAAGDITSAEQNAALLTPPVAKIPQSLQHGQLTEKALQHKFISEEQLLQRGGEAECSAGKVNSSEISTVHVHQAAHAEAEVGIGPTTTMDAATESSSAIAQSEAALCNWKNADCRRIAAQGSSAGSTTAPSAAASTPPLLEEELYTELSPRKDSSHFIAHCNDVFPRRKKPGSLSSDSQRLEAVTSSTSYATSFTLAAGEKSTSVDAGSVTAAAAALLSAAVAMESKVVQGAQIDESNKMGAASWSKYQPTVRLKEDSAALQAAEIPAANEIGHAVTGFGSSRRGSSVGGHESVRTSAVHDSHQVSNGNSYNGWRLHNVVEERWNPFDVDNAAVAGGTNAAAAEPAALAYAINDLSMKCSKNVSEQHFLTGSQHSFDLSVSGNNSSRSMGFATSSETALHRDNIALRKKLSASVNISDELSLAFNGPRQSKEQTGIGEVQSNPLMHEMISCNSTSNCSTNVSRNLAGIVHPKEADPALSAPTSAVAASRQIGENTENLRVLLGAELSTGAKSELRGEGDAYSIMSDIARSELLSAASSKIEADPYDRVNDHKTSAADAACAGTTASHCATETVAAGPGNSWVIGMQQHQQDVRDALTHCTKGLRNPGSHLQRTTHTYDHSRHHVLSKFDQETVNDTRPFLNRISKDSSITLTQKLVTVPSATATLTPVEVECDRLARAATAAETALEFEQCSATVKDGQSELYSESVKESQAALAACDSHANVGGIWQQVISPKAQYESGRQAALTNLHNGERENFSDITCSATGNIEKEIEKNVDKDGTFRLA